MNEGRSHPRKGRDTAGRRRGQDSRPPSAAWADLTPAAPVLSRSLSGEPGRGFAKVGLGAGKRAFLLTEATELRAPAHPAVRAAARQGTRFWGGGAPFQAPSSWGGGRLS